MKLHEINEANEMGKDILIEAILPYKKSLEVLYGPNAILMVTTVFNAAQYGQIVNPDGFEELVEEYVNGLDLTEEEKEHEKELIRFQSVSLLSL